MYVCRVVCISLSSPLYFLASVQCSVLLYIHRDHKDYYGRGHCFSVCINVTFWRITEFIYQFGSFRVFLVLPLQPHLPHPSIFLEGGWCGVGEGLAKFMVDIILSHHVYILIFIHVCVFLCKWYLKLWSGLYNTWTVLLFFYLVFLVRFCKTVI